MNKEQKEIYEYEPIYSQAEIDEWMRVAEEYKEKIEELEAENSRRKGAGNKHINPKAHRIRQSCKEAISKREIA